MGFFSRHRKAFKSVIASFGVLFGLLAGCTSSPVDNTPTARVTKETSKAAKQLNDIGFPFLMATSSEEGIFNNDSNPKTINGKYSAYWGGTRQLIFKNNSVRNGELTITVLDYATKKDASATVFGQSAAKGQTYKTSISGKGEAVVELKTTYGVIGTPEVSISLRVDSFSIQSDYSITFVPSDVSMGVFKVDGQDIVNETTWHDERASFKLEYTFNAQSSFIFESWVVDGESFSNQNPFSFTPMKNGHVISPKIVSNNLAMFSVGGLTFSNLNEAIAKAKTGSDKTIVAVKDGAVAGGDYTLDSGLSLLVPNEDGATLSQYATEDPKYVKNTVAQCVLFRKISFLSGVNLNVYGQVVVCCTPAFKTVSSNEFNNHTAIPSGAYGQIDMQQGSTMVLQSGAKLFAWGFVTGEGLIEARSGAVVYELFQISSWRGGSVAKDMNKNKEKVFIINQYYVQNIECELKIWAGATEKTLTGMYMSLKDLVEATPHPCFVFIGDGGMFKMSSGYLKKQYRPAEDRLMISVNGDGLLSSIAFDLDALGFAIRLDAKDYVLPINNNISISIQNGSSCSTNQDLGFLPGSELTVEKGASFEIQNGHNLTFYDLDNWGNYATEKKLRPVKYSPTRTKTRTEADLTDAKLALDGTLTIGPGSYLMTTGKNTDANIGARIISPGRTGLIKFTDKSATTCPAVYQYYGKSSKVSENYVLIDATFAKLQNGDHSYTQSAPGNTYHYDKVLDRWSLSTDHATKSGLFKTIDNNGVIKTVLLENDVMATGRTGLFYYSSTDYNAGDNHYYYLQSGVVVNNKKWYQENGKWYFFGTNQFAYQNTSAVFTASTGITGFGIQARYFFDGAAMVEHITTVTNVIGLSGDITIGLDNFCYYKSVKAGVGLFEKKSGSNYSVYLAKDDGFLMTGGTYYVPSNKINSIKDSSGKVLNAGLYYFDDNGHMYDSNFKIITRGTAS